MVVARSGHELQAVECRPVVLLMQSKFLDDVLWGLNALECPCILLDSRHHAAQDAE